MHKIVSIDQVFQLPTLLGIDMATDDARTSIQNIKDNQIQAILDDDRYTFFQKCRITGEAMAILHYVQNKCSSDSDSVNFTDRFNMKLLSLRWDTFCNEFKADEGPCFRLSILLFFLLLVEEPVSNQFRLNGMNEISIRFRLNVMNEMIRTESNWLMEQFLKSCEIGQSYDEADQINWANRLLDDLSWIKTDDVASKASLIPNDRYQLEIVEIIFFGSLDSPVENGEPSSSDNWFNIAKHQSIFCPDTIRAYFNERYNQSEILLIFAEFEHNTDLNHWLIYRDGLVYELDTDPQSLEDALASLNSGIEKIDCIHVYQFCNDKQSRELKRNRREQQHRSRPRRESFTFSETHQAQSDKLEWINISPIYSPGDECSPTGRNKQSN